MCTPQVLLSAWSHMTKDCCVKTEMVTQHTCDLSIVTNSKKNLDGKTEPTFVLKTFFSDSKFEI